MKKSSIPYVTNAQRQLCCDFALWIAKYGIYKIPETKYTWAFAQANFLKPEFTTEELFDLFLSKRKF